MPEWTRDPVPTSGSRIHLRLHDALAGLGYYVEDEVAVGRYSLDCYVRELHLGFEADGKIYHSTKRQLAQNAKRDAWIFEHAGVPVLRVAEATLKTSDSPALLTALQEFIDEHAGTVDERRRVADRLGGL